VMPSMPQSLWNSPMCSVECIFICWRWLRPITLSEQITYQHIEINTECNHSCPAKQYVL
jgi:hypothetical protein